MNSSSKPSFRRVLFLLSAEQAYRLKDVPVKRLHCIRCLLFHARDRATLPSFSPVSPGTDLKQILPLNVVTPDSSSFSTLRKPAVGGVEGMWGLGSQP